MNIILILLKREFLKLNNNLFFIIIFLCLFPLMLHLLISIPLSMVIIDIKPIYSNWSASGIWIVTALFTSYIFSFNLFRSFFKIDSLFSLPISSIQFIGFSYMYALIIAIIQLTISIINIKYNFSIVPLLEQLILSSPLYHMKDTL